MIFTAGLGSGSAPIIQLKSIARSPMIPWIADLASSAGTSSPNPPAEPKARRKNFSLFAEVRALCSSSSKQRSRIAGSFSSASSSRPLAKAPTGLSRSWHRREASMEAKSTRSSDMDWLTPRKPDISGARTPPRTGTNPEASSIPNPVRIERSRDAHRSRAPSGVSRLRSTRTEPGERTLKFRRQFPHPHQCRGMTIF